MSYKSVPSLLIIPRACLKDIPDNLIFHLKRFDYDVMTGMRHKINDKFEFPEKIDMSPYNIEFLQDTDKAPSPDIFELVGVLVHAGNAESGHYYSYIRERPLNPAQGSTWVEFNDADVTPFSSSHIPDSCFGGPGEPMGFPATPYPKTWNAYMLFYQRVSAMEADRQDHQPLTIKSPVKEKLPVDLQNQITIENEKFLRNYCLYDSTYASFARSLLDQVRDLNSGICSDDHSIEKEGIWFTLEYLDHVLSRMKDFTDFDGMVSSLVKFINHCPTCCKLGLRWIVNHKEALRNLLLRCPNGKVRETFARMLLSALMYLRSKDLRIYGLSTDSIDPQSNITAVPISTRGILQSLVNHLQELWPVLHLHARAWDDYFMLLAGLASFGVPECYVLLREDFLKLCLELLIVDSPGARRIKVDNPHYIHYVKLIEKGRRYSFRNFILFLRNLMDNIALQARPFDSYYHDRPQHENGKFPMSLTEQSFMFYGGEHGRPRSLVFLEKIITAHSNVEAVASIIKIMVSPEPRAGHLADISKTILNGISIDPASLARPFLFAAVTFCENCTVRESVKDIIRQIAREVDTIGHEGGADHLDFFIRVRLAINQRISSRSLNRTVVKAAPHWAPPLLMYCEDSVRARTLEFLETLIFQYESQPHDDEPEAEELQETARELCKACMKRVNDQVIRQRKQVELKVLEVVRGVIRHCVQTYFQTGLADDDQVCEEAEGAFWCD